MLGSILIRRLNTHASGAEEYEKSNDDAFVWIWDWSNELLKGFFVVSPQAAFVKVYDASALRFRDIIERNWQDFIEMAAWPLVAGLQATDAVYFGNLSWPSEAVFEIDAPTTPAVYGGDACTWEYYNGAAWVALTLVRDETDTTAFDGLRSFQGGGEITFNRPVDIASIVADGQLAEWIRCRPTTPANVTTVPIFAYTDADEFVSSVVYVDNGVTRASERLDGNVSSCLVSGLGDFEATMTSCVGRTVTRTFRFVEPGGSGEDDYGS